MNHLKLTRGIEVVRKRGSLFSWSFKIDSKRENFCKKTVAYSGHESNDFDVIDSRNRKCFYFQFCHENENENESEIGIF